MGNSTAGSLDAATSQLSPLVGGQVDGPALGIASQGGDSRFLQRFALQTHDAFNPAAAMRFAIEHQNPLVTGAVLGGVNYPETTFSLLTISDPNVLLWALKPAHDGIEKGAVAASMESGNCADVFHASDVYRISCWRSATDACRDPDRARDRIRRRAQGHPRSPTDQDVHVEVLCANPGENADFRAVYGRLTGASVVPVVSKKRTLRATAAARPVYPAAGSRRLR